MKHGICLLKMAEGSDLSSIRHGSDAYTEIICTPCGEGDIREEAVKYCPECQEYLCTTCTTHHGRQKATRSHKLVTTAYAKHASTVTVTAKCHFHPERDIEMYCGVHDMVYCTKCIATEHRACDSVTNLEEVNDFRKLQTDIQHAQDEMTTFHQLLLTTCEEKQKNIDSLEEQRCGILEKIHDVGRTLKMQIDKLTDRATDALNKSFIDVKTQLESNVGLLNDTVKDLDNLKNDIQKVGTSVDVTQQFVYSKLMQNAVNQAKTMHDESQKKGIQILDFTENTDLRKTITKAENLGRVVVKNDTQKLSAPKMYTGKSMKKNNVLEVTQNAANQARTEHDESQKKEIQILDFTENTDIRKTIRKAEDLRQVVVMSHAQKQPAPKMYTVKSIKKINVKMERDWFTCAITDVCQLQNGTILLTDWFNYKLIRLDVSYNLRDHCDLDAQPNAICCTGQNEVAVKLKNNKVQFIDVSTKLSKLREISIEDNGSGMVYFDGNLWVSTEKCVNVYSTNGKHLRTIKTDVNGQKIYKGETQHMAVNDDTVIVTDNCDGAVCVEKDGTVRKEFRDQRLSITKGVCVSSDSTVFVSGRSSRNIVMFSSDGKCQGELLTKEECLKNPGALLYDIFKNCLILASSVSSDSIQIIEMSH